MARKRKSADATAAEGESVQPNTGYNGPSSATVAQALAGWIALESEQARIGQQKSTLVKNFEKAGGDGDDLRYLARMHKLDPAEARAKIERRYRYCAFVGIVQPDHQRTLADILDESTQVRGEAADQLVGARAYSDGHNTARQGGAISDSPYQSRPGSIEFVQWRNGWDDGHEDWLNADPSRRERERQLEDAEAADDAPGTEEEVAPPA